MIDNVNSNFNELSIHKVEEFRKALILGNIRGNCIIEKEINLVTRV